MAFIYVSDDMEWGRKHLPPGGYEEEDDLYFVGDGERHLADEGEDRDAASFDLALLASCNHTIITRGTFSMWASILAGGEYFTEYGPIVPS